MQQTDRYAFLKQQAPAGYVAGMSRGAAGFTTRSDIGPAREISSFEAGVGQEEKAEGQPEGDGDEDNERYQDPENESGLFAGMAYDKDDEEADQIYEQVESRMAERRKQKREQREAEEAAEFLKKNPRIQDRFSDLKRELSSLSDQQWENLPEGSNLTGKRRKLTQKNEFKTFVVPDSVLLAGRAKNQVESSLDQEQMAGGYETPSNGTKTDFAAIGDANSKLLGIQLDRTSKDSATGGSTIDPKGYLTDLNSVEQKSQAEIGDLKRARELLRSLINTNKKHAPGWIAAARLEEHAGKLVAARKIIEEGCQNCPRSEEIWREAARLNTQDNGKIILARAVVELPTSVNIWLDAADLESDVNAKKRVIRKALEFVPNSVKLWRKLVNLESNPVDARVLLARAVEVVPLSVELWLALARIETPQKAKGVLNEARRAVPTSHEIWIAAGRLAEQEGLQAGEDAATTVDAIMAQAVSRLKKKGVELPREEWLREAEKCETQGSLLTAQAIVKATIAQGLDEESRLETWLDDAESALSHGHVGVARAIFTFALRVFPTKQTLWRKAADLERSHGSQETLVGILKESVKHVPHAEVLWLMAAKEAWVGGDVPGARAVLKQAFSANPDSEQIWLAACKLEAENGDLAAARTLMSRARKVTGSDRIWVKSAAFERLHGTRESTLETLEEGVKLFPTSPKLYMIKGQVLSSPPEDLSAAREAYSLGLKRCPDSIPLWILASRLEEKAGLAIKARALLERGRTANPRNDELWMESIRVEERQNNTAQAKVLMSRALQECPSSGLLWSESVWMEARQQRKSKAVDALKKTSNDPRVIVVTARMFWTERNTDKARGWFGKAVQANPDLGDSWAWWLKFERQHGTVDQQEDVIAKCAKADPHHGPVWQETLKDPANAALDTKQILEVAVTKLQHV